MSSPIRTDLLDLTTEALTALANPGFVRRARKDLDAGRAPQLQITADGTVTAEFDDGVLTRLPAGAAVKDASCSCPASGWCRHRVTLVLAYQDSNRAVAADQSERTIELPGEPTASLAWSPGDFDDAAVSAAVPPRAVERAKAIVTGKGAVIVRLSAPAGVPTARLPMNAVQFFSSSSPAHAHCDCRAGGACEHLVIAVWAFRQSQLRSTSPGEDTVSFGEAVRMPQLAAQIASVRELVSDACREVVLTGVSHADSAVLTRLDRAAEAARRMGWSWVVADVTAIDRQLEAHYRRSSEADPVLLCSLLAEAPARLAAAQSADADETPLRFAADILGIGVPGEVELGHLRLASLGAQCWSVNGADGTPVQVGIRIHFLDPDTGQISAIERSWDGADPIAGRRLLGTSAGLVAGAQLVTGAARRRALGLLEVAADRRRTSVAPLSPRSWPLAGWAAASTGSIREQPRPEQPRWVGSRQVGQDVVTFAVNQVIDWGWDAAAQRLEAVLDTPDGQARLEWQHSALSPHGVDAIAAVLAAGSLRAVSGRVRMSGGSVVISALAVASESHVVVPAVAAAPAQPVELLPALPSHLGRHHHLIAEVREELAVWARRGIRELGHAALERLSGLLDRLDSAGLRQTAALLRAVVEYAPNDPARAAEVMLRSVVVLDQLDQRL